jgi:hypothetical protein
MTTLGRRQPYVAADKGVLQSQNIRAPTGSPVTRAPFRPLASGSVVVQACVRGFVTAADRAGALNTFFRFHARNSGAGMSSAC